MRRRGLPKKILPGAVLTLCLAVMGTGYAYWDGRLQVEETLSTSQFDCTFSETGSFLAELPGVNGAETEEVPVQVSASDDGKSTALSFPEGLPAEFLSGARELCIRCPIEEKGVKAQLSEADFSKEGEKVTLTPEAVYLALPEGIYTWEAPDAYFQTARTAELYRSVEQRDGMPYACLYLRAAPLQALDGMPEQLVLPEEALAAMPAAAYDFPDNGVWVLYSLETDVLLEQACGGHAAKMGSFGALTAYAYWTDQLKLQCKAAVHFPVNLLVSNEAGEVLPDGTVIDDRVTATPADALKIRENVEGAL